MAPRTSAATPIEIQAVDGSWLPLVIRRPERRSDDDPAYPRISEILSAAEAEAPVSDTLRTATQETWIGGIGVDYNVAPGVYTRTDGVAMAAGTVTQVQVPLGAGFSNSAIVAFAEFLGALYFAQAGAATLSGGRVCKSSDGTGTGAGAFANTTIVLSVGEYVRDLCVHDDGAGTQALYASSSDINGLNGRLHRTTDGINWSSTPAGRFGTAGRNRMRTVHWRTGDNVSRKRLVTISGRNRVSYTTSDGGDPFLAASWVGDATAIEVSTAYSLTDITGARTHLYFAARDNVFDMNESGDTPGLLSQSATDTHGGNGLCAEYLAGWLYVGSGEGAVRRIWVGDSGTIQEDPGICGPGWQTAARSDWLAGYATAMLADGNYIVPALYNPITQRTGVFYGVPRETVNVETRNPLVWYGPEFTINANYQIKRMFLSTLAGNRRLWMATQSVTGLQPNLVYGSVPEAGAPLDVLQSDGLHRYNSEAGSGIYSPFSRLESLPQTFGDKNSLHILDTVALGSEALGVGTKLTVYQRADPLPNSQLWGTGRDVTVSPTQTLVPTDTLQGHVLQWRVDFVNPNGNTAAGITPTVGLLDSVRTTRWDVPPTSDVRVIDLEYGDGVLMNENTSWANLGLDIDAVTAAIKALAGAGRTTLRDQWGETATVKVLQVFAREVVMPDRGDHRKRVVGQLRLTVLDDAA